MRFILNGLDYLFVSYLMEISACVTWFSYNSWGSRLVAHMYKNSLYPLSQLWYLYIYWNVVLVCLQLTTGLQTTNLNFKNTSKQLSKSHSMPTLLSLHSPLSLSPLYPLSRVIGPITSSKKKKKKKRKKKFPLSSLHTCPYLNWLSGEANFDWSEI